MGIAVAFGCQPALTVAGQHFNKKRALAMGIVTTGCGLGGTLYPIMFHKLVPVIGFSWVIRIAALKTG
jgi:MCP family monocarboxylic acid transporter-like MFS transporter 10